MENTSKPDELQQVIGDSSQQESVESKHVLDEKEGENPNEFNFSDVFPQLDSFCW